jgi:hypothetical protein
VLGVVDFILCSSWKILWYDLTTRAAYQNSRWKTQAAGSKMQEFDVQLSDQYYKPVFRNRKTQEFVGLKYSNPVFETARPSMNFNTPTMNLSTHSTTNMQRFVNPKYNNPPCPRQPDQV